MSNTLTPMLGLKKPDYRDPRWDGPLNYNFDLLDSLACKCPAISKQLMTGNIVDVAMDGMLAFIAEDAKISVIDINDPTFPIIDTYTGVGITCVAADSDKVVWGTATGIHGKTISTGADLAPFLGSAVNDVVIQGDNIAVATDGGCSVINGANAYSSATTTSIHTVSFDGSDLVYVDATQSYKAVTYAANGFGAVYNTPALLNVATTELEGTRFGGVEGLSVVAGDMVDYITKDFQSGWMQGDIKGAWLADNRLGVLEGERVLDGDFNTDTDWTLSSDWAISGGSLHKAGGAYGAAIQTVGLPIVDGLTYTYSFEITANTGGSVSLSVGGTVAESSSVVGVHTGTVTPSGSTRIQFTAGSFNGSIDNVSVVEAIVDHSTNEKPLTAVGTGVIRTAVVHGAELVGYSGFSAANYLTGTDASYLDTLYCYGWEKGVSGWEFKHGLVSATPIDGLTIAATVLKIAGTLPKALIRLGSEPSAAQLTKIASDELALFQPGALCTLQGNSDNVKALSGDYVGTADGITKFNGLVVASFEQKNNIVAMDGDLVVGTLSDASYLLPPLKIREAFHAQAARIKVLEDSSQLGQLSGTIGMMSPPDLAIGTRDIVGYPDELTEGTNAPVVDKNTGYITVNETGMYRVVSTLTAYSDAVVAAGNIKLNLEDNGTVLASALTLVLAGTRSYSLHINLIIELVAGKVINMRIGNNTLITKFNISQMTFSIEKV